MTILHQFRGVRYKLGELAEISGVELKVIRARLADGWTLEQAICIPSIQQRRAGVVSNFPRVSGTGGGSVAQDRAQIEFSASSETQSGPPISKP